MGTVATLLSLTHSNFKKAKKNKKCSLGLESKEAYIDKSWQVLVFILAGKSGLKGKHILSEIIDPSGYFLTYEDEYMTEGISYSIPERVREINDALNLIDEIKFKQLFEEGNFSHCYPGIWTKSKEDYDYLLQIFLSIKDIFESASKNNEYIIIVMG